MERGGRRPGRGGGVCASRDRVRAAAAGAPEDQDQPAARQSTGTLSSSDRPGAAAGPGSARLKTDDAAPPRRAAVGRRRGRSRTVETPGAAPGARRDRWVPARGRNSRGTFSGVALRLSPARAVRRPHSSPDRRPPSLVHPRSRAPTLAHASGKIASGGARAAAAAGGARPRARIWRAQQMPAPGAACHPLRPSRVHAHTRPALAEGLRRTSTHPSPFAPQANSARCASSPSSSSCWPCSGRPSRVSERGACLRRGLWRAQAAAAAAARAAVRRNWPAGPRRADSPPSPSHLPPPSSVPRPSPARQGGRGRRSPGRQGRQEGRRGGRRRV